jgi:DNA-binding CsgD family transcriptional regulator
VPSRDDRLLESLGIIGEVKDINDFALRCCRQLLRLVPGINATYVETNPTALRSFTVVYPPIEPEAYARYSEVFRQHMHDNPILRYYETTGEGGVTSWSDVDPAGEFFRTTLYRKLYAPRGIRGQIAFLLPAPPGIRVALVINREGPEFSAEERALLAELRQHLVNLYRLVSHAEADRRRDAALADDGWSVVLVDDSGTVLESNDVAVAIGRAAGVDLSVGARLESLWSTVSGPLGDRWALSRPTAPVRVSGDVPFEARLVRSPVGPHVLWIRQPRRLTVKDVVEALGLTTRQAQVALLLVDGYTNAAIARRLGLAESTVRRHMEAIFDRLGVRSRAAVVGRLHAVVPQQRAGRVAGHRGDRTAQRAD